MPSAAGGAVILLPKVKLESACVVALELSKPKSGGTEEFDLFVLEEPKDSLLSVSTVLFDVFLRKSVRPDVCNVAVLSTFDFNTEL